MRMKKERSDIETLSLQSDNVKCFQSSELKHAETQDGKGAMTNSDDACSEVDLQWF